MNDRGTISEKEKERTEVGIACAADIVSPQVLYRISRELTSNLELRLVLHRVLNIAMDQVQAENGSIIVLDENMQPIDSIIRFRGRVIEDTTIQFTDVLEKGLAGWVLRNRQAAWIADTSVDKRWLSRPDYLGTGESKAKSVVCAPLFARGDIVGVITMVHSKPYCLTQDHLELVQVIADQAGIAVLNARLYAESQQRLLALKQAHEQYREWQNSITAMVYHDIRTPLANIYNSLNLIITMLPETEKPSLIPLVEIAQRAADRIQRLTSSLLDLNRLEAGQVSLRRQLVKSNKIIQDAVEAVLPIAREKRQPIIAEVAEDLPAVYVDEDMILRVLINLLENASKYTPPNLPLHIGAKRETLTEGQKAITALRQCWVQFWVKDSGEGINEEEKEKIFEKFSRLERHSGKSAGYGLGLAYCRLAVEAHGGQLWVESQPKQGASFYLRLPCRKPKGDE